MKQISFKRKRRVTVESSSSDEEGSLVLSRRGTFIVQHSRTSSGVFSTSNERRELR
eukprot:Ihof_evm3s431 gene=Ihof_evmTU3s431